MQSDYAVIATLGPGSVGTTTWQAMLSAGATGLRLNTSHLSLPQVHAWLARLDPFLAARQPRPPLVLDLQGSKWRLGDFPAFDLTAGLKVEIALAAATERPRVLPVPYPDFFQAAAVSDGNIVLDDAKCRLALEIAGPGTLITRVTQGGRIVPRKGITYASSAYRREGLSEKDREVLAETRGFNGVRYAISYVRDAAEMARYREQCGASTYLIGKLERRPAVAEAAEIAAFVDELWLCRGDLGAELGMPAMAEAVSRFSARVAQLPVPALMAGQVLEHMTTHPAPTRSEVCYLHDTLARGYRGFVLSDEAAIGRYPIESCRAAAMFRRRSGGER